VTRKGPLVSVDLDHQHSDGSSEQQLRRKGMGTGPSLVSALEDALARAEVPLGATPLVALLPPPACVPTQVPKVHALLVGINDYPDPRGRVPSLRQGAVRDTNLVERALMARYPAASVTRLTGRSATSAGLHRALTALVEASQCGDIVFLHYSGQSIRRTRDGLEPADDLEPWDDGRVALLPSDRKPLGERTLRGFVTAMRNRQASVIAFLDTSYANAVNLGAAWQLPVEGLDVDLLYGAGDCTVMTAGGLAQEYVMPEGPTGAFSLAVALALQREGSLTVRSLASTIAENVRQVGKGKTSKVTPFFEASNPEARLLPGPSRTATSLEVHLDGEKEADGLIVLKASPAVDNRKVVIAGTVVGETLSPFLVNGSVTKLEPGGRFQTELEGRPGLQKVKFTGVRTDQSVASTTRDVQIDDGTDVPMGQRYALLIGIQQYDKWDALVTPLADVRDVGRILREKYGFATTLAPFGSLVLENPRRFDIGAAFQALRRSLGPNDHLLVYYAGHGHAEGPKERRHGYWIPRDAELDNRATWFSGQALLDEINDMRARHVLIVSDSCFAGDLYREGPGRPADVGDDVRQRLLDERSRRASRMLITSGFDEPVLDKGGGGHSVFARAFIDGLQHITYERFLSADLFYRFIFEQVGGKSTQQPHHDFLHDSGHDGGDFPFVRQAVRK
jgi:Caspase domain